MTATIVVDVAVFGDCLAIRIGSTALSLRPAASFGTVASEAPIRQILVSSVRVAKDDRKELVLAWKALQFRCAGFAELAGTDAVGELFHE